MEKKWREFRQKQRVPFSPKPQARDEKAENKAFSRGAERRRKPFDATAWWAHQDSNLEPKDYESSALTIEL